MKNQSTKRHDFQGKNNLKVAIYCRFASENQEVDPTEKIEKANEFFKNFKSKKYFQFYNPSLLENFR